LVTHCRRWEFVLKCFRHPWRVNRVNFFQWEWTKLGLSWPQKDWKLSTTWMHSQEPHWRWAMEQFNLFLYKRWWPRQDIESFGNVHGVSFQFFRVWLYSWRLDLC
jgi:hypothetical protein